MKDKSTGIPKGYAFITFQGVDEAIKAVHADHFFRDKNCDVRFAFHEEQKSAVHTNRIFVARIPSSVGYPEFRSYFEAFGSLKDAYMPRDSSKSGHRGIGFVTFANPESVERVMAIKHSLGGNELAIDAANPKERQGGALSDRLAASQPNLNFLGLATASMHSQFHQDMNDTGGVEYRFSSSSGDVQSLAGGQAPLVRSHSGISYPSYEDMRRPLRSSSGLPFSQSGQFLPRSYSQYGGSYASSRPLHSPCSSPSSKPIGIINPKSPESASYLSSETSSLNDLSVGWNGRFDMSQHGPRGESIWAQMSNNAGSSGQHSTGPLSAQSGPRIFVGKLNRETSEFDLKNYFSQFGFVLDVYLPRDKTNKREHRGFGFVTFETDAAIHRALSYGSHTIHGSTLAIDTAVPRMHMEEQQYCAGQPQGLEIPGTLSRLPSSESIQPLQQYLESLHIGSAAEFPRSNGGG